MKRILIAAALLIGCGQQTEPSQLQPQPSLVKCVYRVLLNGVPIGTKTFKQLPPCEQESYDKSCGSSGVICLLIFSEEDG